MLGTKNNWAFPVASLGLFGAAALGLMAYQFAVRHYFQQEGTLAIPDLSSRGPGPAAGLAGEQPLVFLTPAVDLGSQKNKVEHSFELENRGPAPLTIIRVSPSCSCTATQPDRETLNPGEKCTLQVTVDLRHQPRGYHRYSLEVAYQDPTPRNARAEFTLINDPDVQFTPKELSLIQIGDARPKGTIALIDYREKPLEISWLQTSSSRIRWVLPKPQLYLPGWKYLLELETSGESFPAGSYHELLTVHTDHADFAEIKIPVHVQKYERMRTAPLHLILRRPSDKPGELFSGKFFLIDTKGEEVEVDTMNSDSDRLTWSFEKKPSPGKQIIGVVLKNKEQPVGSAAFTAKLTIRVKKPCQQEFVLPVSCLGESEPGSSP